jgi:hypothetical protein
MADGEPTRMMVVVYGYYNLESNLDERQNSYGCTDPTECAKIDSDHEPDLLLSCCEDVKMHVIPLNVNYMPKHRKRDK